MTSEAGLLDGRVVIVTGGGRGIGRSHCIELARQGAIVVVNDLGVSLAGDVGQDDPARGVVDAIEAAGGRASAAGGSVSDWRAMGELVSRTVAEYGRLDGIVNNAGILRDKTITSLVESDWDAVIDVHLKGTLTVTKHACDYWRTESKAGRPVSARIVNTTSGTGLAGNAGQAAYGAAKAAIANLTMTTAIEGSRYGVTANCISPVAHTRMTESIGVERSKDGWDPMDPENCSTVVAWLCSEASGWLTGKVLRIDGNTVYPMEPWSVQRGYRSSTGQGLQANEIDLGLRRAMNLMPTGVASLSITPGVVA